MMQVSPGQVVAEATTWIGTPFVHGQSCKGHGADCVGLVYGVFKALGCLPQSYQPPAYSQQWHVHKNEEVLLNEAKRLGCEEAHGAPAPGDLLFFQYGRVCSHVGIYVGAGEVVHAFYSLQRAVNQPLAGDLSMRLRKIMKTPWVSE